MCIRDSSGLGASLNGRAPGGGMLSKSAAIAAAGSAKGGAGRSANGQLAGAGQGRRDKDKKDKRRKVTLIGYEVETLDDQTRAPIEAPGAAAGTSADLAPLADADQNERW
jgi:hypothetical protein